MTFFGEISGLFYAVRGLSKEVNTNSIDFKIVRCILDYALHIVIISGV